MHWKLPDNSNSSRLGFHSPQDALDFVREIAEDGKHWYASKHWNFAERYAKGEINIVVNCSIASDPRDYDLVFSPVPSGARMSQQSIEAGTGRMTNEFDILNVHGGFDNGSVFVGVSNLVQGPQGRIPSLVWLERSKKRLDFVRDVLGFAFDLSLKFSFSVSKGKVRPFSRCRGNDSTGGVIECRPEIIDSRNRLLSDSRRQRIRESDYIEIVNAISVNLGDSFVNVRSKKQAGKAFYLTNVILCPPDKLEGAREFWRNGHPSACHIAV